VAPSVVPGSDGAGEVVAVGSKVTRFGKGAKVVTLFNQAHYGEDLSQKILATGLGGALDGTLRQYGVFNENGLAYMPNNLDYLEAGTLSCAPLTAWNALYGLKPVSPGDWVLTQGTGGVSIAGLQFAKAAGARVVATTSSSAKAETLRKLGADHVINYKENPNWGEEAKRFTGGVQHVIEIGGPHTITQSLKAVALGGVVTIVGWVGGMGEKGPDFPQLLASMAIVRGIVVGSREQFEAMVCAQGEDCLPWRLLITLPLDPKTMYEHLADMKRSEPSRHLTSSLWSTRRSLRLKISKSLTIPSSDDSQHKLIHLRAYQYLWDQKHVGKVAVKIE
jgi:NADPH:quinone reductase-like Zn-dependent oxidoreductase